MNLLNGTGMAAGYTVGMDKEGAEYVVVAVKGTFTLPRRGEQPALAPEQTPLADADLFTGEPGFSATLFECDYALEKPLCDVLLNGAAYAPGGRPTQRMMVGLQFGSWRKTFAVYGDRVWRNAGIGYIASAPAPFERMPISYDNAFGGTDDRLRDPANYRQYPANPVGRGWRYHRYPERIVGLPLPNTEAIGEPVRDPCGSYRPMAFGPIGCCWPPRIKFAGTYDQAWLDNMFPFLAGGFRQPLFPMRAARSADRQAQGRRTRDPGQSDPGRAARIRLSDGRNADCLLPPPRRPGRDKRDDRHGSVRTGSRSGSASCGAPD